jgi:hypothetical protein
MMEFVAAPMRQRKGVVALSDPGKFGRQIRQLVRDESSAILTEPNVLETCCAGE